MNYKYPSFRGLKNYFNISEEELIYILNSESLFGRKFTKQCNKCLNHIKYIDTICNNEK